MRKERPILYSTPMVQAIFEDRKELTRRTKFLEDLMIDEQSGYVYFNKHKVQLDIHKWKDEIIKYCPYGVVGDLLWVRETFWKTIEIEPNEGEVKYHYKASPDVYVEVCPPEKIKWKPSIHMPKDAARIWLEITNIRVERLQDITEKDAIKEGVEYVKNFPPLNGYRNYLMEKGHVADAGLSAKASFETLWKKINGVESWEANPFVWCLTFKRVNKP